MARNSQGKGGLAAYRRCENLEFKCRAVLDIGSDASLPPSDWILGSFEKKVDGGNHPGVLNFRLGYYLSQHSADPAFFEIREVKQPNDVRGVLVGARNVNIEATGIIPPASDEFVRRVLHAPRVLSSSEDWVKVREECVTDAEYVHKIGETHTIVRLSLKEMRTLCYMNLLRGNSPDWNQTAISSILAHRLGPDAPPTDLVIWLDTGRQTSQFAKLFGNVMADFENEMTQGDPLRRTQTANDSSHHTNHLVGLGTHFKNAEQRPQLTVSRNAGSNCEYPPADFTQHLVRMALGLIEMDELDLAHAKVLAEIPFGLRLLRIPEAHDELYLGIVENTAASSSPSVRLAVAEKVVIQFDPCNPTTSNRWSGIVLEGPSILGGDTVTILLRRPTAQFGPGAGFDNFDVCPSDMVLLGGDSLEKLQEAVIRSPSVDIRLSTVVSDKPTSRALIGYRNLQLGGLTIDNTVVSNINLACLREHLLFKDTRPVGEVAFVDQAAMAWLLDQVQDAEQQAVASTLRNVPKDKWDVAVAILQGCPGSGKTTLLAKMITAMMLGEGGSSSNRVALFSNSNVACDVVANAVDREFQGTTRAVVMRCHPFELELLFLQLALLAARNQFASKGAPFDGSKAEDILRGVSAMVADFLPDTAPAETCSFPPDAAAQSLSKFKMASRRPDGTLVPSDEMTSLLLDFFSPVYNKVLQKDPERLVGDSRFRCVNLSAAKWAMRACGLGEPASSTHLLDNGVASALRREWDEFVEEGLDMSSDEFQTITALFKQALLGLYSTADVIVGTVYVLTDTRVSTRFTAEVLAIDEAGRLSMSEYTALEGHYACNRVLLVGDQYQLPPMFVSKAGGAAESVFVDDCGVSVMDAYIHRGWKASVLATQKRSYPGLMSLAGVFYANKGGIKDIVIGHSQGDAVRTFAYAQPVLRMIRDLGMHAGHDMKVPVALFEIRDGQQPSDDARFSKYIKSHAAVTMHLLERLIYDAKVESADICILTPYRASVRLFENALLVLGQTKNDPSLARVKVATSDEMQGGQSRVVLFVPMVADKPGFVESPERLGVSLSRAQDAMLIVATTKKYDRSRTGFNMDKWADHARNKGWGTLVETGDPLLEHDSISSLDNFFTQVHTSPTQDVAEEDKDSRASIVSMADDIAEGMVDLSVDNAQRTSATSPVANTDISQIGPQSHDAILPSAAILAKSDVATVDEWGDDALPVVGLDVSNAAADEWDVGVSSAVDENGEGRVDEW